MSRWVIELITNLVLAIVVVLGPLIKRSFVAVPWTRKSATR